MTITKKRSLLIYYYFNWIVSMAACIGPFSLLASAKLGSAFPYHVYVLRIIPKNVNTIYICVTVGWFALIIVNHDCLFVSLVNNARGQLGILKLSLKNIQSQKYESNRMTDVVNCIRHHIFILRMRDRIENVFTHVILLQFFTSFGIFALTGFLTMVGLSSMGSQATIYTYCCCISFELFIYCEIVTQVISEVIRFSLQLKMHYLKLFLYFRAIHLYSKRFAALGTNSIERPILQSTC